MVYEFHGCFIHAHVTGCLKGLEKHRHPYHQNVTYEQVAIRDAERLRQISNAGVQVRVIWECEARRMIAREPSIKEFMEQPSLVLNYSCELDARKAVMGGRVEAMRPYFALSPAEIAEGFQIR